MLHVLAVHVSERFNGNKASHAIVERLADNFERRFHERLVEHHIVAHLDALLDVRCSHAKINKELFHARYLGAFGIVGNVDRLAAGIHDAVDVAAVGDHGDATGKEVAGVKSTSGVQPDESVVINVSNVETDLIHVCGQQHGGWLCAATAAALGGVAGTDQRAHGIDMGRVKQATARFAKYGLLNHRTHALFATRNAGGFAEATEEFNIKSHGVGVFRSLSGVCSAGRDGANLGAHDGSTDTHVRIHFASGRKW